MLVVMLVLLLVGQTQCVRILAVVPSPSVSHHLPIHVVLRELASRGHQITYITPDPMKDINENITQIDVSFTYNTIGEWHRHMDKEKNSTWELFTMFVDISGKICDEQLGSPQIKQLIQSGQTFDLVIMEVLAYQAFYGLYHKVGSPPLVGYTSLGMNQGSNAVVGSPDIHSYMPNVASDFTDHMVFWQRAVNAIASFTVSLLIHFISMPNQERIMRKHFGHEPPSVFETEYNYSIVISGSDFVSNYPAPHLPNVVEVTGLHIKKERSPLPEDIKEFLNGADAGAIYFSLGSNVKSKDLSQEILQALLEAFSELPQRVLWKWEADSLPGQPDNVMVAKWLPQQDVLAHPNVHAFITQGGLQSFHEASYFAVPMIGIPILGDQEFNVAKMEASGIGLCLKKPEISKETVIEAVKTVFNNASYRENMRRFSTVFREHQEESLDKAVWWIEYVIRHNGARHLRSAALDLYWWQYLLLDVVAFLIAALVAAGFAVYVISRKSMAELIYRITKSKTD